MISIEHAYNEKNFDEFYALMRNHVIPRKGCLALHFLNDDGIRYDDEAEKLEAIT